MGRPPCAIVVGALLLALWAAVLWPRYDHPGRSRADCEVQQRLWDGQIAVIQYVAQELVGSPVQSDLALENIREQLGPRPAC